MNSIMPVVLIGLVFVLRFAMEVAAVVVGLVIWDRYLRRR